MCHSQAILTCHPIPATSPSHLPITPRCAPSVREILFFLFPESWVALILFFIVLMRKHSRVNVSQDKPLSLNACSCKRHLLCSNCLHKAVRPWRQRPFPVASSQPLSMASCRSSITWGFTPKGKGMGRIQEGKQQACGGGGRLAEVTLPSWIEEGHNARGGGRGSTGAILQQACIPFSMAQVSSGMQAVLSWRSMALP